MYKLMPNAHQTGLAEPSDWVVRWANLIPQGARVLDVACGSGRHACWLAAQGYSVLGIDRNAEALAQLPSGIATRCEDLEAASWPLAAGERFSGVVVTNYLHRPLWPVLLDALLPQGVLIYETFAVGNATVGRPSNPAFLLQPGELLDVAKGRLRVIAYEDGYLDIPRPAFIQRVCAVLESKGQEGACYPLYAGKRRAV